MSARLALPEALDRIDGERVAPTEALGAWICNANDGTRLVEQRASSDRALERALACADRAHASGVWSEASPLDRAAVLERVASQLEARLPDIALADAATTGVVVSLTRKIAAIAPHAFRGAAALLRAGDLARELAAPSGTVDVWREPWGPAAIIAPWNAPGAIAAHKTASALAAGCPVILKPSEWAPHACNVMADALEGSGVPTGVFQMLHGGGRIGARLVADARVRAVSFTGGLAAGLAVARACAEQMRPVQLELGGNNPLVVLSDADIELASRGIVLGLTTLNGQWCRAVGRVLVHAKVADRLLTRTLERLADVALGSSLDADSEMGPLAYAAHHARVLEALTGLEKKGGTLHATTKLPALAGYFCAPTLVTGVAAGDARDEIFGPVATVHMFDDDGDAIALANDSPFGLAGYVFGADEARARTVARKLRAGSIKVNGVSLLALHNGAPRPAWGLSGFGDEGARETLAFFGGHRVVGVASKEMG